MADEEILDVSVKYGLDYTGFQNGVSKINQALRVVDSEFKAAAATVGKFGDGSDQLKIKSDALIEKIELQKLKVAAIEEAYRKSVDAVGATAKATQDLQIKMNLARAALGNMQNELQETNDQMSRLGEEVKGQGSGWDNLKNKVQSSGLSFGFFAAAGAKGFQLVTEAAKKLTDMVIGTSIEMNKSLAMIGAQTGLTKQQTQELGDAATAVFDDDFGESMGAALEGVTKLRQNLGDMSKQEMKAVTEGAMTIEKLFGQSIEETSKVVKGLTDNFKDLSKTDAMDIITKGFQDGLNYADDYADTLNEYAVHFRQLGFSAQEMFAILETGKQNGAFNLDKVGDAVKELGIRVKDGSATTVAGFQTIGLNAQKMAEQFAAGGDSAKQAFYTTIASLRDMKDPVQQNIAGVDLFGSQWEDLGKKVVLSLDGVKNGLNQTKNATNDAAQAMQDNLTSKLSKIWRTLQTDVTTTMSTVLQPVFDWLSNKLLPVITDISKVFTQGLKDGGFIQGLIDARTEAEKTTGSNSLLSKALWDLEAGFAFVTGKMDIFNEMLSDVGVPDSSIQTFDNFRQTVIDAFTTAGSFVKDLFGYIVDHAKEIEDGVLAIGAAIGTFKTLSFVSGIVDTYKDLKVAMEGATAAQIALNIVTEANPWVLIGTGLVALAVEVILHWKEVSAFLKKWGEEILLLLGPVGLLIDGVIEIVKHWDDIKQGAISAFNGIGDYLKQWGTSLVTLWSQIKEGAVSIWRTITSGIVNAWNGITSYFSPANNRLVQFFIASWNEIKSSIVSAFTIIQSTVTTGLSIISTIFTTAWESIKAVFSTAWGIIKTIFATAFLVIYDVVTGNWSDISNVFAEAHAKLNSIVSDLWTKLTDLFTGATTKIVEIIVDWWKGIKEVFVTRYVELQNDAIEAWKVIHSIWDTAVNKVVSFVSNLVKTVVSWWTNLWTTTKTDAKDGWDSVISFFANAPSRIWSALTTMWSNVTTWFDNLKSDVRQIGVHIVEGLWDGITSMGTWISDNVGGWLKGLAADARHALDIHSPSRVFAEIGGYVAEGLAVGINEKAGLATDATSKMVTSVVEIGKKSTDELGAHLSILKSDMDVFATSLGNGAASSEQLGVKLQYLTQEMAVQNEIVKRAHDNYMKLLNTKGAYAKETADAASQYANESKALSDLQTQITDTTKAIQDQAQALSDLQSKVQDVAKSYNSDLTQAQQDYNDKAAQLNQQLLDQEQQLTDKYNQELQQRTDSLRNFVGLFDAVQVKPVSGQLLLNNLQSQVTAFEDWQKNMKSLASRNGIDKDLVDQLQAMGPQAGAQIAALNSLTDDQLKQYVELWRKKNAEAKKEATDELAGMKTDTQKQIDALRVATAKALDKLKAEWDKKNAEIRQSTLDTLQKMVQDAEKNGQAFVDTLAQSITTALPSLVQALGGISDVMSNPFVTVAVQQSPAQGGGQKGTTPGAQQPIDTSAKVITMQQDTIKKMVTVWQNGKNQLAAIWDAITKDAQVKFKKLTDLIQKDWLDIEAFFGKIDLKTTGQNIMAGLIAGMQAMEPAVIAMARSIADSIRSTIQSALDIHSPSRVTAELGGYVGAGLVVGMDGSLADLKRAADRMARAALPSLDNVTGFRAPGATANGAQVINHYHTWEGDVVIPARDLKEMQDVSDLFKHLKQIHRARGGN